LENFQAIAANAALSAFSGQSQNNRLMRLDFPFQDGPHAILLANRLDAQEEVSRSYRYNVEVLSDDARIPLKVMMARMVTISLVRADGSLRFFNGYVTEFRLDRTDGGFAFYHMVLEPWLAFTRLRKDSVSFHGKSVREITEETLKHFREADWHLHIFEEDPRLTVANQHNETDFNHLHRRWEALGLHYWFEHRYDGHTLMLSDSSLLAEPIDAIRYDDAQVIPFRATGGAHEDDGIHAWSAVRQLGSGSTTLASFDYKYAATNRATGDSTNAQGDFYPYEIYENTGQYGFALRMDGEQLAQKRMVARDTVTQYFEAAGNDRVVQPGRVFRLGGHFSAEPRPQEHDPKPRGSIGDREYLILTVRHEASNNYQAGPGAPSHYKNTFTCVRSSMRWRPGLHYNSKPCTNPGLQTAIVVGPPGSEIHTDNYGRVKIQFHWDRLGKCDENSSPWIRVMAPAAGDQFGQIRLPRVGEEVAVVYPDGNIDHPLILGAVHNGKRMPPWALPEQAPLAGMRSRELGGGTRGNHLILDDTKGKIQAQLKSDHQCSQLSLGHITRIEDNAGRKDARGEGFELRTDGHGVTRAAKGILITTEPRQAGGGPIKDMGESSRRLDQAHQLHDALATAALKGLAQETGQQHAVADILKAQYDAVHGSDTEFPEIAQPHLLLASPAGIETTTAKSTHIASGEHTALTTGRNLSIAAGDSVYASIKQTFRLFVHKAGMKLVAAAGKITVQAHDDDIHVIANKVMSIISETDWIDLRGKKGVRLHGADCMLEISDLVQFFTSKPVLFHGNLETLAQKNKPQPTAAAKPENRPTPEQLYFQLQSHADDGLSLENVPYTLYQGDTRIEDGITDEAGGITVPHKTGNTDYTVQLAGGDRHALKVSPDFAPAGTPLYREQVLSNQGTRQREDTENT
jgi:type VI secretion system secreted protein VgrG